jgi:hypothetical protein
MIRWKRYLQGILTFVGIMLFLAPAFNLMPWNIGIFGGIACFVALGIMERTI